MVILPRRIPEAGQLRREGYDIREYVPGEVLCSDCTTPLRRIAFLNLMPEKEQAMLDICRVLNFPDIPLQLVPLKFRGRKYKNADPQYMDNYYVDAQDIDPLSFDALLVNGAPVEHLPFEDVDYWSELCTLMDTFTAAQLPQLYICWAAQAALYHFYGIPKYPLPRKCFGIYSHILTPAFCKEWNLTSSSMSFPISRYTTVRAADIRENSSLTIVAESPESGVGIVLDTTACRTFISGHGEYGISRLATEYHRDIERGLSIHIPEHYYRDDNPQKEIVAEWHTVSRSFFRAWLLRIDNSR